MIPKQLPDDINAETLLGYFPEGSYKVALCGSHKRNAYHDILKVEEEDDELSFSLGRNSLYDSLPEYVFHPIDRFGDNDRNQFLQEHSRQKEEEINSRKFFKPIDLMLFQLRLKVKKSLEKYVEENKIIIDIVGDRLTEEQKSNRFILKALAFLPSCKNMRGDVTVLTMLLRKIFMEEGLSIELKEKNERFIDDRPRYNESLGATLDSLYLGNEFDEKALVYNVFYWPSKECNDNFLNFIKEAEMFRQFIQDYFMSVEETLVFDFHDETSKTRLSDDEYNYLSYNTNL